MENPFRPGNGIEPPFLAGRSVLLKDFEASLGEFEHGLPRNRVLFGLRGTGKTVVMKRFSGIARSRGWIPVAREFGKRYCKETEFAEALAVDVTGVVSELSVAAKLREYGRQIYDQLKPSEISVKGISYRPFYGEKRCLLDDYLKELLVGNWPAIRESGAKGVIFLYDEFHSVCDNSEAGEYPLSSLLSALSHAQREGCKYYLVASGLPNIDSNLKHAKTYAERMFSFSELVNLTPKESEEAILAPLRKTPYSIDGEAVGEIVRETNGYPYFLQFYGYYLLKNAGHNRISTVDFRRCREGLLRELDASFFKDRLERATPLEQDVLYAMAKAGAVDVSPTETLSNARMEKSMLFAYLRTLAEKNLVYKTRRGKYSFTVPLFREFLLRRRRGR